MSLATRREALGSPHRRDFDRSIERKAQQGVMPRDLSGLMRWYREAWEAETPDALHGSSVYSSRQEYDRKTGEPQIAHELVGGSHLGTPAYAGNFRSYLENSSSQTDEDGSFLRPMHRALAQMTYEGRPLMARNLFAIACASFDWHAVADAGHWAHEMYQVYIREALICAWRLYIPMDERRAVA